MEIAYLALATLVGAFVGSYLASYLKKKGEDLATHEDIAKIVDQMKAVTHATKEIEAKITSEVWERQTQWAIKRDALFEVVKELGTIGYGLFWMDKAFHYSRTHPGESSAKWEKQKSDSLDFWNQALLTFRRAMKLSVLVSGEELRGKLGL